MAGEWEETTLGEVLTLQRGFDLPSSERTPGPYPVVASTGTVGTHVTSMVGGPGVVIGRSGSLGGGQYIRSDFWPLNTTLWVKDFKGNDPRFCYYLLRSLDLGQFNAGSGVPTLNRNHIHPLPVAVPTSLSEQRSIGHILGALDDKIELNRRMSETLEAMARALFKSWFVDFDPVRAKAEGRDPGLPKPLADLFPARLVDSELGEIPEGWEVGPLAWLAELMIGGDWGREAPKDGDVAVRCLRGVDIDRIRKSGWTDAPVRFVSNTSLDKRIPSEVDVLVEGSGECGRSIAAHLLDQLYTEGVVYSNFCKRLRCKSVGSAYYLEFLLNSLVQSGEMKNFVTGTAMPNLDHKGLLEGHWVVSPPGHVLQVFGAFVSAVRKRLYSGESRTLAALRDTLLPRLISGELRVSDAEGFIEGRPDG